MRTAVLGGLIWAGVLTMVTTSTTQATIIGSSSFDSATSRYTYSYVVDNSGGAFAIDNWQLEFNFALPDWTPRDGEANGVVVPGEWIANEALNSGPHFAQDFLLLSGSPVAPGDVLRGFSFSSAYGPGQVTFYEFGGAGNSGPVLGPVAVPDSAAGIFGPALLLGLLLVGRARST